MFLINTENILHAISHQIINDLTILNTIFSCAYIKGGLVCLGGGRIQQKYGIALKIR